MNTNGQDAGKSRRLKTIIVSIIAAAIIILASFWAVSSIMGSKKADNGSKTTETSKEEKKTEDQPVGSEPVSPSQQYNPVPETQTPAETTPAPVAQNNDIPTTGASDVIFSAIMLGVVASLAVYNIQLVKEQQ
jgi:flagellar basal body-associated protein FliL